MAFYRPCGWCYYRFPRSIGFPQSGLCLGGWLFFVFWSTDVVDASAALVVSSKALILLMKVSESPGSNWIKILTIVSNLFNRDLLCLTAWENVVVLEPTTNLRVS